MELSGLTIAEARRALDAGEYSSLDLTNAYLDAIKAKDGEIHAYLEVWEQSAREEAKAADILIKAGKALPLTGIPGGAILTNQQLLGAQAVKRGQSVTLIADAGGITVRMAGRALNDGLVNERIKVQNLSSGKTVEGIARSAQVVEIVF